MPRFICPLPRKLLRLQVVATHEKLITICTHFPDMITCGKMSWLQWMQARLFSALGMIKLLPTAYECLVAHQSRDLRMSPRIPDYHMLVNTQLY